MEILPLLLETAYQKASPASEEAIAEAEERCCVRFPEDLRSLLRAANGLSVEIGDVSLYIWSTTEIVELTQDYGIHRYVPGLITIGSYVETQCLCLDYRESETAPALCSVPYGDIAPDTVRFIATSLTEFVRTIQSRK